MIQNRFAVALLLGGLFSGCGSSGTPNLQPNVSNTDGSFMTGATQSSNAEISAATFALTRTHNAAIISFANEMTNQHGQEKAALAPIAESLGVALPTGVNAVQAATAAKLMATPEPAFDALYINSEINGHTMNLDDNFKPEVAGGQIRLSSLMRISTSHRSQCICKLRRRSNRISRTRPKLDVPTHHRPGSVGGVM